MSGMRHAHGLPPDMKVLSDLAHFWEASGLFIYFLLALMSVFVVHRFFRSVVALCSLTVIWAWLIWIFMLPSETGEFVILVPTIIGLFLTGCGIYVAISPGSKPLERREC
jgi:hypothetical protein